MITTTDRPTPTVVGAKSEVGFTIDPRNLAHVVSLLRDAYSDPITAVLREYSVNAADAHTEAGIPDRPIKVTLPGRLDPVLKIRDFGRGLTPEQIEGLFCSYGASSKRQSNDYTGCLGIGCKSAFAITDSFTVTTYHGGRARSYSCFLDESEVGKAVLLSDKASNETGVLVSIPIKRDEIGTVESKAIEVYRYFKVRPEFENLTGNKLSEITKPDYLYKTDGVGVREGNSWRNDDSNIVMGNIAYPIKSDEVGSSSVREVLQYNRFDIEVPIGAVDIAPSREELKYNTRTKKAVTDALKAGIKKLGQSAVQDIANTQDLFEAIKIYKATFQRHKLDGYLRGLGCVPKYKGKELTSTDIKLYDKEEEAKQHGFSVRRLLKLSSVRRGKSYQFPEVSTMEIGLNDRLYHDTSSNQNEFYGRVRTLLLDPKFQSAYVFKTRNGGMDYLKRKQPLLNEMTFEDFASLEITPPEKTESSTSVHGIVDTRKHGTRVFQLKADDEVEKWQRYASQYWVKADVDLKTDSGVYFEINHFKVQHDGSLTDVRDYVNKIKLLRSFGYDKRLYGFKPSVVESLAKSKNTNWVPFSQKFKQLWEESAAPYREAFNNYQNYETHVNQYIIDDIYKLLHEQRFAEGTVAAMYKDGLDKCIASTKGVSIKHKLEALQNANAMHLLPELKPSIDLAGLSKMFFQRYPMAKFWAETRSFDRNQSMKADRKEFKDNIQLLIDYINYIDEKDPVISTSTRKDKGE